MGPCDRALFPGLRLPPNDPDSWPPQLLQQPQPPELFREMFSSPEIWTAAAALKEEGGWSACHSEEGQTKRN